MRFPDLWHLVFPPRPRPRRWGSILVGSTVAMVVAIALLVADRRELLSLSQPQALGLLVLLPYLGWLQACSRSGLPAGRAAWALAIRLVVTSLAILALAGPRAVRPGAGLNLIYCLDLSHSIGDQAVAGGRSFIIRTAGQKPESDRAGLVVFGRTAGVELPPAGSLPLEAINVQIDPEGTDLAGALTLAGAVLDDGQAGRVVLISDGVATGGDLTSALTGLRSRQVAVDVLPVSYQHDQEVWLDRLDLPRQVRLGETYEAGILVAALSPGQGELVLRENGREIARQAIDYPAGRSRHRLALHLRQAGYYEYAATIEVPPRADGLRANNTALGTIFLRGEARILIAVPDLGTDQAHQTLAATLRRARRQVEVIEARSLPADTGAYQAYDGLVLVDVPADACDRLQMQAVRDAVRSLGMGLVMVGGPQSYGAGGWRNTPVEEALPVSMDISQRKMMPKGALAIVLHTCEFAEGNTWAKRITRAALQVLSPQDEAGVLAYSWKGQDEWVVPFAALSAQHELEALINRVEPGDMPSFTPTMQLGLTALSKSDAAARQMIIISDGDPSPPPPQLLQQFVTTKVAVSTVAIHPHGNDTTVMEQIATITGGRFYFPRDPAALPQIFIKEARTLQRHLIHEKTFVPVVHQPSSILKGLDALPPVHGLVLTMAKPRAEVVLKSADQDELEPVLAVWRYGLGRAAAFTPDLANRWGRDWLAWDGYGAFVEQLITDVARVERPSQLAVTSRIEDDQGLIEAEDHHPQAGSLRLSATVLTPDGSQLDTPLEQVAPGRYQGTFRLGRTGRYQILVAGSDGSQRHEQATDTLILSYAQEFRNFRADPTTLSQIARMTGGRVLNGDETGRTLYGVERPVRRRSHSILDLVLAGLVGLFVLDVASRRVQIDWPALWARLRRRSAPGEHEERLADLLARKRAIAATHRSQASLPTTRPPPKVAAPPASPPPPAPPPQPPAAKDASTTGKLLELKRRRQGKE